jgi:hypothetical protein
MTTHRNLKPHYAERKGKSGPVIVVKKPNSDLRDAAQAVSDFYNEMGWYEGAVPELTAIRRTDSDRLEELMDSLTLCLSRSEASS